MGRLIVSAQMSADAVMDHTEGWFDPRLEAEAYGLSVPDGPAPAPYSLDQINTADALVLGRLTYEGLSAVWPGMSDPYGLADRINSMPKYVASRTLTEATWNAQILGEDAAGQVAALKEHEGQNLLKFGTGEFSNALLHAKLVDEYHFWLFPVIAGGGDRLFDGLDAMTHLQLVDTTRFRSGIVVLKYSPK
jgi:dihydrofolate reductase